MQINDANVDSLRGVNTLANQKHLDLLKQGVKTWNLWRLDHPYERLDFSNANLQWASLAEADLSGANFCNANLHGATLAGTRLCRAHLRNADISFAYLQRADLCSANLQGANLRGADLQGTNLYCTDLRGADLRSCAVHGATAWSVKLEQALQSDLVITHVEYDEVIPEKYLEPIITVDNLEMAQFIYLLFRNEKIRDVIDTITSKVVLILGRFTPERKLILDTLRDELRKKNYSPVLFDFEKPASRDLTGTVSTLAHLARFIVVDLTDPSSAPYEVATIIPHTVVPVQPLLLREPLMVDGKVVERREFAMFEDLRRRYRWVLPTFRYQDTTELLALLNEHVIAPAEQKAKELVQHL
jgi:hypothetical protein